MNITYNPRTSAFSSRTTALFTTNVNITTSVLNSGGTGNTGNNTDDGTNNVMIDPKFLQLLNELLTLYIAYAIGDYLTLKTTLTNEYFYTLSTSLGSLQSTNPMYLILKSSIMYSLQGLQRAYVQYILLDDTTTAYLIVKERAAILDDMDKLKVFIDELNARSNTSILGDYNIESSVSAMIAPEYLIYITQYGYPMDGVFDVEKLSKIVV
jgi:hypothetical protein